MFAKTPGKCSAEDRRNVFTAETQRTPRVDDLFYPAVRGGRIKGNLSQGLELR
jgi:hypothetical protein